MVLDNAFFRILFLALFASNSFVYSLNAKTNPFLQECLESEFRSRLTKYDGDSSHFIKPKLNHSERFYQKVVSLHPIQKKKEKLKRLFAKSLLQKPLTRIDIPAKAKMKILEFDSAEDLIIENLQDAQGWEKYFNDLIHQVIQKTMDRGIAKEISELRKGKLSGDVMEEVLKEIALRYGINSSVIKDMLSDAEFKQVLSRGVLLFDENFKGLGHGYFSHAIQITYLLPFLEKKMGKLNMLRFIKSFGSRQGRESYLWRAYFDATSSQMNCADTVEGVLVETGLPTQPGQFR